MHSEGIFIVKSIGVYVFFEDDNLLKDHSKPLYHDCIISWKVAYLFDVVNLNLSFEVYGTINANAMFAIANKAKQYGYL